MPWPVTHILVAEKVFDRYFSHLDRKAFLIGTSFPDIRYPAKIDRGLTHFSPASIPGIQFQPSFRAGVLFHGLIDGVWNRYIHLHHEMIFSLVPHNRAMFHAMKVLQDGYLYPVSDRWAQVVTIFDQVTLEEQAFGIPTETVDKWHRTLRKYLNKPPESADLSMLDATLPADLVAAITEYYIEFDDEPTLRERLTDFYAMVETLLIAYENQPIPSG